MYSALGCASCKHALGDGCGTSLSPAVPDTPTMVSNTGPTWCTALVLVLLAFAAGRRA